MKEETDYLKKKRKYGCIVPFGIFVLLLVFAISYCAAWNAGWGLPNGYYKSGSKSQITAQYSDEHLLYSQFENENTSWEESRDKIYFVYNGNYFYLQHDKGSIDTKYCGNYSVYKNSGEEYEKTGEFIKTEREGKYEKDAGVAGWIYFEYWHRYIFFDDCYLYYTLDKAIERHSMPLTYGSEIIIFIKREFYRFNLETGQNEKINIKLFVEKLQKYDDTAKID